MEEHENRAASGMNLQFSMSTPLSGTTAFLLNLIEIGRKDVPVVARSDDVLDLALGRFG